MHPPQRLTLDQPAEGLQPKGVLPKYERALVPKFPITQSSQVLRHRVVGSIDDPQVLPPTQAPVAQLPATSTAPVAPVVAVEQVPVAVAPVVESKPVVTE